MKQIMPIDKLFEESAQVQEFLEITLSDDPMETMQRSKDLCVYVARTGKMLADAKYHLHSQMKIQIIADLRHLINNIGTPISSKLQNTLIECVCKDEHYLVNMCDRLNRTATHQLDLCRSLISYAKAEMTQL